MTPLRVLLLALILLAIPLDSQQPRGLRLRARLSSGEEVDLYSGSYALVIGVTSYEHWDRLINPLRDAREVGQALKNAGFDVTYVEDPDSEELKGALNSFAYGVAGQDEDARLVVFFAGHGHTEKTASGQRGFILPRDAPKPEIDRVGFMSRAVSMDFIKELATGMLAKHVLFVFDSCFSGTLLRGDAHPGPITARTTKKVRQFITSGSADEQVPDESVFKVSLLNALEGDADKTDDGYVTGEELGWYLKGRVMEYSKGSQTPQYGKIKDPNLDQGDIVFVLKVASAAKPAPEPAVVAPPPPLPATLHGHLQINVNTPDSRIYVDNTYRGLAGPGKPLNLQKLAAGPVRVRVEAEGYREAVKRDTIRVNEWTQVEIQLSPIDRPKPGPQPEPTSKKDKEEEGGMPPPF